MIAIDNQPIIFNLSKSCQFPTSYKQLVNQGDNTQFQFRLEVCPESPNLLTNSSFISGLSGWTQAGTGFTAASGSVTKSGTATALIRQNVMTIGNYYKCEIEISAINTDESSNIAEVRFGADTRFFPLYVGKNELWGRCLKTTSFEIRCNNNSQITVDSALLYEVDTNYIVTISQEDGSPLVPIYLEQATTPWYNVNNFDLDRQFVTCTLDWNALSIGPGCYTIGVFDACENEATTNIINYDFSQGNYGWAINFGASDDWVVGFAISPSGNGTAYFFASAAASPAYLYNSMILTQGVSYTVTYRISAVNSAFVQLFTGKLSPGFIADNTLSSQFSDGVFTETFTPTQVDSVMVISVNNFGGNPSAVIDYVSVKVTNITDATPDFISEPLRLGNHECTHSLRISNDSDAFGFSFLDFAPRIRLDSDLRGGRDLSERKIIRTSAGQKKTYFADVIFAKDLVIGAVPEYVHNFLRYCTKVNYLYIDNISYFVEDDEYPDISWNKQRSQGAVTLEVSENKLQLLQNSTGASSGGNSGSTSVGSGGGASSGGTGSGISIGSSEIIIGNNDK